MKNSKISKIQYLLISHLLSEGSIELTLPDGMIVELGITQEGKNGLEKCDDYCWVIASQDNRSVSIDSFNLGLRFSSDESKMVFEDELIDHEGFPVRTVNVA